MAPVFIGRWYGYNNLTNVYCPKGILHLVDSPFHLYAMDALPQFLRIIIEKALHIISTVRVALEFLQ